MSSETTKMGISCEYYRPFEILIDKSLTEKEYAQLKPKMEKKPKKILDKKQGQ